MCSSWNRGGISLWCGGDRVACRLTRGVMGVASDICVVGKGEMECFMRDEGGGSWREVTCVVCGKLRV